MKKLLITLTVLLFFISLATADITPQDNFNGRDYYNITNFDYISGNYISGDGSNLTNINIGASNHNSLSNLQGGSTNEYYHLNQTWYQRVIDYAFSWITGLDSNNNANSLLLNNGTNIGYNQTILNESIQAIDTATNTSMKNYVDSQDTSYNTSMKNYVDSQDTSYNTSMKNYVDSVNSSQTSWTDSLFVRFTELVSQVGNFSAWDKSYSDLIDTPTLLSNFTDDLGDRGYTNNLNFTNGAGYYNSSDFSISDYVPYTGATTNLNLGSNNFSVDTNVLFVDSNNNRVGVGTTSPQNELNIIGDGNFTGVVYRNNKKLIDWTEVMNGTLALNSSLSNYYTKTEVDTNIESSNTSMKNYVDSQDTSYNTSIANWADGKFVVNSGGDSLSGQYDFNGGWTSNGLSIIDGNLYAQTGYFYNISGLNVDTVSTNGSLYPTMDNQFDLGNQTYRWKDLNLGGSAYVNGNLGIGTTNPELQLDVANGIKSGGRIQVTGSGELPTSGSGWEIYGSSTSGGMIAYNRDTSSYINGKIIGDTLQLQDGSGNVNLYMSNDQKIGIGTTSPNRDLDVDGDARVRGSFRVGEDGVSNGYLDFDDSGGKTNNAFLTTNSDADLILGSHATGSDIQFKVGNPETTKVTIDTDGNLGIGTTSPTEKLEIAGNVNISGNPNLYLDRTSVGTADLTIASGSVVGKSGLYIRNNAISSGTPMLHFRASTSGDPEMVIDNGGNVGIGTTSPLGKLEIKSDYGVSSHFAYTNNNTYIRPASTTSGYVVMDYGNVGIGTSNPSEKLEVNGDIQTDWWNSKYFKYKTVRSDPTANKWYHIANITLTSSYDQYSGVFRVNGRTDTSTSTSFGLEFAVGIGQGGTTTAGSSGATIVSLGSYGGYELNSALVLTTDSNPTKVYELYVQAPSISYFRSHITVISSNPFNGATFEIVESDTGVSSLPSGTTTNMIHTIDFNSNGDVGIGTSSPSSKLNIKDDYYNLSYTNKNGILIQSNSFASGKYTPALSFGYGGLSEAGIAGFWDTSDNNQLGLAFFTHPSSSSSADVVEQMRIDKDGNVGIGTDSPSKKLEVSTSSATDGIAISSTSNNPILSLNIHNTGNGYTSGIYFSGWNASSIDTSLARIATYQAENAASGNLRFYTADGGTLSEAMRIDKDGKVGIGTSSPSELLDVDSDSIRIRTAQTPASASATCSTGQITWDTSYIYVCTATNTWKRSGLSTW